MNLNKTQLIKNRNIKAVGQSPADLIIRTIIRHRFRLFVLAQVCLALSAAMPITSNGSQAVSDDATAGRWGPTGNLHTARDIHTATLLPNGLVLVAGGLNTGSVESRSAELYDSASGTWAPTGNLNEGRFYYTATLLLDGKVLVAGGDSITGERASAESVRSSDRSLDSHRESQHRTTIAFGDFAARRQGARGRRV